MVCKEVHRVAYFYLDGALDEQRQNEVKTHLSDCHDCDDRFMIHDRIRKFVQRRIARVIAPENLRSKITVGFSTIRTESSS